MKGIARTFLALFLISMLLMPQLVWAQGTEDSVVSVNAEHFPDAAFRTWVLEKVDANRDDLLSTPERMAVSRIDVTDQGVESLIGIDLFPNLAALSCGANAIQTLDLSGLPQLAVLDVGDMAVSVVPGNSSFIAVHGSSDTSIEDAVSDQRPFFLEIEPEQTTFDLSTLDPLFAQGKVANLKGGAQISGTELQKLEPGQHLTYTYRDGCSVPCNIDVVSGNYWIEPLKMAGWVVGSEAPRPTAEARYGVPVFSYGPKGGPFTEEVPTAPGSYVARATVPAGEDYDALEAQVPFEISAEDAGGDDSDSVPSTLEAYYGDTLSDVVLPADFAWVDPSQPVGNVGINRFSATFTLEGLDPVEMTLAVRVLPKPGDTLEISPITNEYEANHIVIRNGDEVLVKGTDYFVTNSVDGDEVTVIIHFMGNYTGEVVRTFSFDLENVWIIPLRAPGWTYGEEPRLPEAEARYGETQFTYAAVENPTAEDGGTIGTFTAEVPEAAGTYVVRATVPETIYYNGLEDEVTFVIAKAQPDYTLPQGLQAIYGTLLQAVALPTGFAFSNPADTVGDVGEHTFAGTFTPTDSANYETASVQIQLQVTPKNGANFSVDSITNETQLQNPVVRDGNTVLVRDRDYTITITRSGNQYTLTVRFIGNYTGQLVRTYNITQQNGGGTTLTNTTNTGSTSGGTTTTAPRTDDSANLSVNILLAVLSCGVIVAMMLWIVHDFRRDRQLWFRS